MCVWYIWSLLHKSCSLSHVNCLNRYIYFLLCFTDDKPSDSGLLGVLEHVPVWYNLAVKLGVPIDQVNAYRLDPAMGGLLALQYWSNGRSGGGFPTTWKFLLETVKKLFGPRISDALETELLADPTWVERIQ